MTETLSSRDAESTGTTATPSTTPGKLVLRAASALACAALGFALVVQLQSTEELGERLQIEREEDLAQILADLSAQSDRLQNEITDLRLTLLDFQTSAQSEELALRSLRQRLDALRVLAGTTKVRGPGVRLTVTDPTLQVTQAELVDTVQELRDAGAEAIAVGDVRLVASSSFVTRDGQLIVDGTTVEPPYTITAVGPGDTIAQALDIPGGAVDALEALPEVTTTVEVSSQLTVPPRADLPPFVFGEPVPVEEAD